MTNVLGQVGPVNVSIDFSGLANSVVTGIITAFQELFKPIPITLEKWLMEGLNTILSTTSGTNVLTHIPEEWTVDFDAVTNLWRQLLVLEAGLGAVVLMIGGYLVMQQKVDIWHYIFRWVFFVMVGNTVLVWYRLILKVINGLTDFIGLAQFNAMQESVGGDIILGLILIVALIFAVLAALKGAAGVVWVMVLIVSAPIILPIAAIPLFQTLGFWWVKELTRWSLRPVFVSLALKLGLAIAVSKAGVLEMLFAVIAFWIAYKMDNHLDHFATGVWGAASNMNLLKSGASMLGSGLGAVGSVAAGAAATGATAAGVGAVGTISEAGSLIGMAKQGAATAWGAYMNHIRS